MQMKTILIYNDNTKPCAQMQYESH